MNVNTIKDFRKIFNVKRNPLDFKVTLAMCTNRGIDAQAVQRFIKTGNCTQPKIHLSMKVDDSLIDRARSVVASSFLRTDSDVLIFLDDDIVYEPLDVIKIAVNCMNSKEFDIIGGAYMTKTPKNPFFVFRELKKEPVIFAKGEKCVPYEVDDISTGFMAIRRNVLEELSKTLPLCHAHETAITPFYPFFQPYPEETEFGWVYKSEDWAFCSRARKAGFRVWIDTSIKLGHIGKHIYTWEDFVLAKEREKLGSVNTIRYNDFPSDSESDGGSTEGAIKEETQNG